MIRYLEIITQGIFLDNLLHYLDILKLMNLDILKLMKYGFNVELLEIAASV